MFSENRLSTTVLEDDWLVPDDLFHAALVDYEAGPVAVLDTSEGLFYQRWDLSYHGSTGDFTITPEDVGTPQVVTSVASVSQCTLAFDRNAHPCIAYTAGGMPFLYWYDSVIADFATLALDADVTYPTVTSDDKRVTQAAVTDILLFYTRETDPIGAPLQMDLYFRMQRDRYLVEYPLETDVNPYVLKLGMNVGLRVQIGCSVNVI